MTADELTSIIGGTFGFKMKGAGNGDRMVPEGDANASKTPFGAGERLRKRVVRAVQAHQFVNGGDSSKFFDGLETEAVSDILGKLEGKDASIFTVYDNLTALRSESREKPVSSAFDPKNIAKLIGAYSEAGAVEMLLRSRELALALAEFRDVITVCSQQAAKLAASKAA
jgi:hypothetical protein